MDMLTAVLVLVLIFAISFSWTTFMGAPWVPTSMQMVRKMLELAKVGPEDLVYDLGCGDGRMIFTAVRRYGARAIGVEIDPLRYLWCQVLITVCGLRDRVKIIYGNFFSKELADATVITCYLLQDTNEKLEEKLKRELRPGTRVVSNAFDFFELPQVHQDGEAKLYQIPPEPNMTKNKS